MVHRRFGGQPSVAREQSVGDDPHRCCGGGGRHIAALGGPTLGRPLRRLREDRDEGIDRARREIGGDDLALLAPQFAVGGKQAPPDRRLEQRLDDVGLHIIGGVVEQHPADRVRLERDMDIVAEHLAPDVGQGERSLRPAIDRRPRPLADKAAPDRHRAGIARRKRRDETRAGHAFPHPLRWLGWIGRERKGGDGDRGAGSDARHGGDAAPPRVPRPPGRPSRHRLHRGVRALLLLRHADPARALHGARASAHPARREYRRLRCVHRRAALALRGAADDPGAGLAHLRHLHRLGLFHADLRRSARGRLARQNADDHARRSADGGGSFPDGVRHVVPARSAAARARRRLPQGQSRRPGRGALPARRRPRDRRLPALLYRHQRGSVLRAFGVRRAGGKGRLALGLRRGRSRHADRSRHLSGGTASPAARAAHPPRDRHGAGAGDDATRLAGSAPARPDDPGAGGERARQPADVQCLSGLGRSLLRIHAVRLPHADLVPGLVRRDHRRPHSGRARSPSGAGTRGAGASPTT